MALQEQVGVKSPLSATTEIPSANRTDPRPTITNPLRRLLIFRRPKNDGGLLVNHGAYSLKPSDIDWTGWFNRYGREKDAWTTVAQHVTTSAEADPKKFKEDLLAMNPLQQNGVIELMTFSKQGGDMAPRVYAEVLTSYYQPHDAEDTEFNMRRAEFLDGVFFPFPAEPIGRTRAEKALSIFFDQAERNSKMLDVIKAEKYSPIVSTLIGRLSKDTNTALLTKYPHVFAALGGRSRSYLTTHINLERIPSSPRIAHD